MECTSRVREAAQSVPGVRRAYLFTQEKRVVVRFEPGRTDLDEVGRKLGGLPFGIRPDEQLPRGYWRRDDVMISAAVTGPVQAGQEALLSWWTHSLDERGESPAIESISVAGGAATRSAAGDPIAFRVPDDLGAAPHVAVVATGTFGEARLEVPLRVNR